MQTDQHSVSRLCQLLNVSRSGYYAWKKRGPSQHAQEDEALKALIQCEFDASQGTYGSQRLASSVARLGSSL